MENGSLAENLSSHKLDWSKRYKIALAIARVLAYLHEECLEWILHCDIKPQNILLDTSFVPKVADFGMAKFLGRDFSHVLTTFRGTIGYLAPEWISGVAITPKVDVYSYGMMLLEIVSGQSNSTCKDNSSTSDNSAYFPVQVASKLLEGHVESLLDDKLLGDVNLEEVERVCKVACWCIQDSESNRPTMGEVVQFLVGLLELEVPPIPRILQAIAGNSP
jgi:serine/threonine protein kinase